MRASEGRPVRFWAISETGGRSQEQQDQGRPGDHRELQAQPEPPQEEQLLHLRPATEAQPMRPRRIAAQAAMVQHLGPSPRRHRSTAQAAT